VRWRQCLFHMSHNFKTVVESYLRRSVAGFSPQMPVSEHEYLNLLSWPQNWQWCRVSCLYFLFPSQHLHTIATYSHSDHRPRHIISCFCSVFNWILCLCHCQEYQWMNVSVRGVSAYPECSGFVFNFEKLYVLKIATLSNTTVNTLLLWCFIHTAYFTKIRCVNEAA
jgi:hypothetical protein